MFNNQSGRDTEGHMGAFGPRRWLIASTRRASNRHPRLTMYIKTLTIQGFKSCAPLQTYYHELKG